MSTPEDVYVIMPVFNEAEVVGSVIKEVQKYYKKIICINDGSNDGSSEEIEKAGGTLVEHCINLGAGAAIQTGIDYALTDTRAKYFITIDADGQHEIKDAVKMVGYLKDKELDIVFGSRFLGEVKNMTRPKKIILSLAAKYSHYTSGVYLTDPHIGLKVFNRKFAERLEITMPDFSHASEIVHRAVDGNYKLAEFPASVTYSDYSRSKGQPGLNAINIMFDLFLYRFTKNK